MKEKPSKPATILSIINASLKDPVLSALFLSFTKDSWNVFLMATIRVFTFGLVLVTNMIDAGVAFYFWYNARNKNVSKTADFFVRLAAAIIVAVALVGILFNIAAIAVVGVFLFIAAMGVKFVYSAALLVWNAFQLGLLRFNKANIDPKIYDAMFQKYMGNMREHGIGALVSGIETTAVILLMALHIAFPPLLIITVAVVAAAAILAAGVYRVYQRVQSLKEAGESKETYSAFTDMSPHQKPSKTAQVGDKTAQLRDTAQIASALSPTATETITGLSFAATPAAQEASISTASVMRVSETKPLLADQDSQVNADLGIYRYDVKDIEVKDATNFYDVKDKLIKEIDAKRERVKVGGADEVEGNVFSNAWQKNKRANKLSILEKLSDIVQNLNIPNGGFSDDDRANVAAARQRLKDLYKQLENPKQSNSFQSFWQIRGQVESLVDRVEILVQRAEVTTQKTITPSP